MLCRKYAHLLPEYPSPPPPRVPPRTLPAGHSRVTVSRLTERALEGRNPRSPEWVHGGRRGEGVYVGLVLGFNCTGVNIF